MTRFPRLLTAAATLLVAAAGCAPSSLDTLHLSLQDIDVLGDDFVYEGWLIVDGEPISTGRFSAEDTEYHGDFDVAAEDLATASRFVLTIEPAMGDDPAPSDVHILAGPLVAGEGTLSIGDEAALGDDFSMAGGVYILETPTSANDADDYDQGIWFLEMDMGGPVAGLDLPVLPAGWTYEGWVVVDGEPISTGTFLDLDVADSDGPGQTAGPDGAPPFPGADFIDPAIVLTGGMAVISVEPVPDNSPLPFGIKPLVDSEIEDLGAGVPQELMSTPANAPTGSVGGMMGAM